MDDDLGNLYDVHYEGSRIFSWVAEIFGLSVDLVSVCSARITVQCTQWTCTDFNFISMDNISDDITKKYLQ